MSVLSLSQVVQRLRPITRSFRQYSQMATIKVGDTVPEGTFNYIPWTPELENGLVCGVPNKIHTDAWKGKTVVIVAVPGAFTPTCHANHLPPFVQRVSELKSKGASVVACLASNDQFVMSGWGRSQGIKDEILMLSDTYCAWTDQLGLSQDLTERGMGKRTKRFALILDDLKVKYIGVDSKPGVVESSVDAVLAHL